MRLPRFTLRFLRRYEWPDLARLSLTARSILPGLYYGPDEVPPPLAAVTLRELARVVGLSNYRSLEAPLRELEVAGLLLIDGQMTVQQASAERPPSVQDGSVTGPADPRQTPTEPEPSAPLQVPSPAPQTPLVPTPLYPPGDSQRINLEASDSAGRSAPAEPAASPPPVEVPEVFLTTLSNRGEVYSLPWAKVEAWKAAYPDLDVEQLLREAKAWHDDQNASKRKTMGGLPAFFGGWLRRAKDRHGLPKAPGPPSAPLDPMQRLARFRR